MATTLLSECLQDARKKEKKVNRYSVKDDLQ